MPDKKRYWRDPEKHRAEWHRRTKRLKALGISRVQLLSPASHAKNKARGKLWIKLNHDRNLLAQRKYRRKLQKLFGSCCEDSIWKHHMMKEAKNAADRRIAIATLL